MMGQDGEFQEVAAESMEAELIRRVTAAHDNETSASPPLRTQATTVTTARRTGTITTGNPNSYRITSSCTNCELEVGTMGNVVGCNSQEKVNLT